MFTVCVNQKKSLKIVHNNIISQYVNIVIKMDTIFVKKENIKTSQWNVLMLNLTDKLGLRTGLRI